MPQGVSTMKNNTGTFGPYFLFLCAFFMMVFSVLSVLGWLAIGGSLALLILTAFLNPDFRKSEDPNNPVSTWLILAFCIFGASWVYTLTLQNGNTHPGINAALALVPTAAMGWVFIKHSAHAHNS
jgi:hypothetical protein